MTAFFYSLCIAPLEAGMRLILEAAFAWTASWGFSLLIMSLAVNVVLLPLYHLAEGWQEDERAAQKRMAAKLSEIKAVYRGRERYMFTRALYRLHGYTPLLAVRSAVGLLIQIPFFFAAYHLLNKAPELAGQSFLFLDDLSRPDGLLRLNGFAVNALPFVMTAVNLLSAAVYTARLEARDKVQLYALAALFLLLLYPSSSALLLYWTCNNVISFFKNLWYRAFVYQDTRLRRARPQGPGLFARLARKLPGRAPDALALLCLACLIGVKFPAKASTACFALMGLCVVCGVLADRLRQSAALADRLRQSAALQANAAAPLYALRLVGISVALCVYALSAPAALAPGPARLFGLGLALCAATAVPALFGITPLLHLFSALCAACGRLLPQNRAAALYYAALAAGAALLFVHTPALLYTSDPDFFYESLADLCGRTLFWAFLYTTAWALAFQRAPLAARPFLATAMAWLALLMLLYVFAAPGDYGSMDGFVFQDRSQLTARIAPLVDAAVILSAALLAALFLRKAPAALAGLLQALALVLCLVSVWQLAALPPRRAPSIEEASARLPDYAERLFGFSRDKENTLVVMMDMFTGGHAGEIFSQDPALAARFQGFTWYPDTASPSGSTLLSLPGMLGGERYAPQAVNERGVDDLRAEINRAYAVLPNIFVPRGLDVAMADLEQLDRDLFASACPSAGQTLLVGRNLHSDFTGFWHERKGLPRLLPDSLSGFLVSVGAFRAAPWTLRRHIYNNGAWLTSRRYNYNVTEGSLALMDSLPHISNTRAATSTFKYMTSLLSHYPWSLDAETCLPRDGDTRTPRADGVIVEHLAAERCSLRALGRWLDWMRANGVYDNTQIVIISDHGYGDSAEVRNDFVPRPDGKMRWRPHALLLVKPRKATGPLQTDLRPIAGTDLAAIICRENGPCPGIEQADPLADAPDEKAGGRVRRNVAGHSGLERHEKSRFLIKRYEITGSMFDRNNWRALDD